MKFKIVLLLVLLVGLGFSQTVARFDNISSFRFPTLMKKWGEYNIILGTPGGAVIYNYISGDRTYLNGTQGIGDAEITCIRPLSTDEVILGSVNGYLYVYNKQSGTLTETLDDIVGKSIVELAFSRDTLWALTGKSLSVFLRDSIQGGFSFKDSYSNFPLNFSKATSMLVHNHFIYLGTDNGLMRAPSDIGRFNLKDQNNWEIIDFIFGASTVVEDFEFSFDTLLIATDSELFTLEQNLTVGREIASGSFHNMKNIDGKIYLAGQKNVYRFKGGQLSPGIVPVFSGSNSIRDFAISGSHQFYLTGEDGIRDAEDEKKPIYFSPLPENINGEISQSANGNIYVATSPPILTRSTGVYRYSDRQSELFLWHGMDDPNWFRANAVRHVKEVLPGVMLMCTWGGGFWIIDENEDKYYVMNTLGGRKELRKITFSINSLDTTIIDSNKIITLPNILSDISAADHYAIVSYADRDYTNGYVWLTQFIPRNKVQILGFPVVDNTVDWADTSNVLRRSVPASYKDELHSIEADMWGTIWVGSAKSGIASISFENLKSGNTGWRFISSSDGLASNDVRYIQSDKDGYVWIGTASGVNIWSGSDLFKGREEAQPIGLTINNIFVDEKGNRWFATDKGISMLKYFATPWQTPDDWVHYYPQGENSGFAHATAVNLPLSEVKAVFLDEVTGTLYASTYKGLVKSTSLPAISNNDEASPAVAFPNPFMNNGSNQLRIKNLQAGALIKIISLNGMLIRELRADNPGDFDGYWAVWDGKDGNGNTVPSGVYVYVSIDEQQSVKTGKIIVIQDQ